MVARLGMDCASGNPTGNPISNPPTRASLALRPKRLCALLGILALALTGCHSRSGLPKPSSKTYTDFVSAFYTGLGALQVGDDVRAENELSRATQLAPGEPAAWANWAILALRQRNFDA